jgi:hypothetical protein
LTSGVVRLHSRGQRYNLLPSESSTSTSLPPKSNTHSILAWEILNGVVQKPCTSRDTLSLLLFAQEIKHYLEANLCNPVTPTQQNYGQQLLRVGAGLAGRLFRNMTDSSALRSTRQDLFSNLSTVPSSLTPPFLLRFTNISTFIKMFGVGNSSVT